MDQTPRFKVGDIVKLRGAMLCPKMIINEVSARLPDQSIYECIWFSYDAEWTFDAAHLSEDTLELAS